VSVLIAGVVVSAPTVEDELPPYAGAEELEVPERVLRTVVDSTAAVLEAPVAPLEHAVGALIEFEPKNGLNPRHLS
jgi:hypothetical protein